MSTLSWSLPPAEPQQGAPSWQQQLAGAYRSLDALVAAGLLAASEAERWRGLPYQLQISAYYASLFDPRAGSACPIRRQAMPSPDEVDPQLPAWAQALSQRAFGHPLPWRPDPIGDHRWLVAPRLTHRYGNRAILHISPTCAVYCRFCFRKHHLSQVERELYGGSLGPALAYLSAHPEVHELILTGGDPLSLSDRLLARLMARLAEVGSLQRVRIHSRMPVTLPARLTPSLADALGATRLPCILMAHFNHPRELTELACGQLAQLRRRGIILANQAVLLAGINDRLDTLSALLDRLTTAGVLPVYLHHPDWTVATFGFRVPIARGQQLMARLAGRLGGISLPRYVVDLPGGGGKACLTDAGVRCLQRWAPAEGEIGGALYQIPRPQLRQDAELVGDALYADLHPRQPAVGELD